MSPGVLASHLLSFMNASVSLVLWRGVHERTRVIPNPTSFPPMTNDSALVLALLANNPCVGSSLFVCQCYVYIISESASTSQDKLNREERQHLQPRVQLAACMSRWSTVMISECSNWQKWAILVLVCQGE